MLTILQQADPERGNTGPCLTCSIRTQNQHTNREGGQCDGIKNGHFTPEEISKIRERNSRRTARYERN